MAGIARSDRRGSATLDDLLAIPERVRHHEVIGGELVPMASPAGEHGTVQRKLGVFVDPFDQRPGGRWPGGWWLVTDVEVRFEAHEIYRPDLSGWRRDRVPERPRGFPVEIRPDWVGEILSPSNTRHDRVTKLDGYHRFAVPHYWILDPGDETLSAYRWTADGYLLVKVAAAGDRVRVEPFEAIELAVAELFGHDSEA